MGGRGGSPRSIFEQSNIDASKSGDPALEAVAQAIRATPAFNQQLVTLAEVRDLMAQRGITDREQQDAELIRLARAQKILLVPYSNQKVMSPKDWDAQIIFGNQRKGAVMLA